MQQDIEKSRREIATPRDYSDGLYRVYFEVVEVDDIISDILDKYSATPVTKLTHGYEATMAIQAIPDVVREVTEKNMAIYQVIRYAKI